MKSEEESRKTGIRLKKRLERVQKSLGGGSSSVCAREQPLDARVVLRALGAPCAQTLRRLLQSEQRTVNTTLTTLQVMRRECSEIALSMR